MNVQRLPCERQCDRPVSIALASRSPGTSKIGKNPSKLREKPGPARADPAERNAAFDDRSARSSRADSSSAGIGEPILGR